MPMLDPLGIKQSGCEPAVITVQLAAPLKSHRERPKTSQFAADAERIGS